MISGYQQVFHLNAGAFERELISRFSDQTKWKRSVIMEVYLLSLNFTVSLISFFNNKPQINIII